MAHSRSTPRLRLTLALLVGLVIMVVFSKRDFLGPTARELVQLAGLACVALAALGRVWTSVFVAGLKDAQLVREGPYSACRHPLYGLSMLGTFGLGLATSSISLTAGLLCIFAVIYAWAIAAEDAHLASLHGEAFAAYRNEVPAVIPDLSAYHVPVLYETQPRVLWKAIVDAASLLGAYLLIRLADLMQATGIAPALFTLP